MPTFPLRTINCTDIVLVPLNENVLLTEIRNVANPRQQRTLVPSIEKSIKSVSHKLSVAMYQAALICDIKPDDFEEFERLEVLGQRPLQQSPAEYKGCVYNIEDIHHYRLLITLFVETFAAANFSLLDVIGHLINSLYDLGKTEEKTSFHIAFEELHKRKKSNPDAVYNLLSNYRLKIDSNGPDNPNVVSWFNPLRKIRNRTTHQLITDVCEAQTLHRRSLYDDAHTSGSPLWF